MPSASHRPMRIRGYTLLEMIIVLAIIVLLGAMIVPAIRASLSTSELSHAAKRVRVGLAKTRLRAIQSGTAQQFRFQLDGRRFEVGPQPLLDAGGGLAFTSSSRAVAAGGLTGQRSDADHLPEDEPQQFELPDGVSFSDQPFSDQRLSDRDTIDPPSFDSGSTARLRAHRWSTPIIFYPNGRTSNARIRLIGGRGLWVDVTLRGVTGTVHVGDPRRREQPQ